MWAEPLEVTLERNIFSLEARVIALQEQIIAEKEKQSKLEQELEQEKASTDSKLKQLISENDSKIDELIRKVKLFESIMNFEQIGMKVNMNDRCRRIEDRLDGENEEMRESQIKMQEQMLIKMKDLIEETVTSMMRKDKKKHLTRNSAAQSIASGSNLNHNSSDESEGWSSSLPCSPTVTYKNSEGSQTRHPLSRQSSVGSRMESSVSSLRELGTEPNKGLDGDENLDRGRGKSVDKENK